MHGYTPAADGANAKGGLLSKVRFAVFIAAAGLLLLFGTALGAEEHRTADASVSSLSVFDPSTAVQGDIDCDGTAGAVDLRLLLLYSAGSFDGGTEGDCPDLGSSFYGFPWGDLNCDREVDVRDALSLVSRMGGLVFEAAVTFCTLVGQPFGPISLVAAGFQHTCAIKGGGAWCWGSTQYGSMGQIGISDVPVPVLTRTSGISDISARWNHICTLSTGAVACWGANNTGQVGTGDTAMVQEPWSVEGLQTGVTAITTGQGHTCALKAGGVWCWGWNVYGQIGAPPTDECDKVLGDTWPCNLLPTLVPGLVEGVSSISAGQTHTCAIKEGQVLCWGNNTDGQVGSQSTSVRISP